MALPPWQRAVLELLGRSGTPQRAVAASAGLTPATLNRYLRGRRSVPAGAVRRINASVMSLLQTAEIGPYLTSIAASADPTPDSDDARVSHISGYARLLRFATEHLNATTADDFDAELEALPLDGRRRLFTAVDRAWRKRLLRRIDGETPKTTDFEEMVALCLAHGIDVTPRVRQDHETRVRRLRASFELEVQRALAAATDVLDERNRAEAQISAAFTSFLCAYEDNVVLVDLSGSEER